MKPTTRKENTFPLDLRVSKIRGAGVGLFARIAFRKGESLCHLVDHDVKFVAQPTDVAMAHKFGHRVADGWLLPKDYGRMSLWWYANHSDTPNVDVENDRYVVLRDIAAGEEITTDYSKLENQVDNLAFRPGIKAAE